MTKDWTGNKRSTFATLGASSHADHDRETNDYYATHPSAIPPLFKALPHLKERMVWECACGEGHLSKEIAKYTNVTASDLIDRGHGIGSVDFLLEPNKTDMHIITNPPFKMAQEFVEKALELTIDSECCFFLRIQFLEGQKRLKLFNQNKLKKILVFSKRVECAMNGNFSNKAGASAACYAWFVFNNSYNGKPEVEWI